MWHSTILTYHIVITYNPVIKLHKNNTDISHAYKYNIPGVTNMNRFAGYKDKHNNSKS
jgi:hypothetical protein